jgi:asparagine synthase (glutamine-hydrolysing)
MCGILGFSGSFDTAALHAGLRSIAHRGPDDSGIYTDTAAGIGLGHVRLSILDLSPAGHQPMASADESAVIVFNGEIYNFRELRAQLESEGHSFRSQSDTEVLLALYRARGEGLLPLLNGIFAFAIYDKSDQTLFLACDAMGVKPLYFHEGSNGFAFASELKALRASGAIPAALDVTALYRYLGYLWSPGGATPFQGVTRLGPGEALRVKGKRIARRWHWAKSSWTACPAPSSENSAIHQVEDALRTAVHRQMVSDVPVGAFLSGGLDSSAVVAMAREVSPDIDCFTIDTGPAQDAGVMDDLPHAHRVARHLGVRLHEIQVDASRMAMDLEHMVYQLDEPQADPATLNVLYISQLARQHGITVLLSGAGGDDLFTGYRRHHALMLERYWAWLPRPVRSVLRRASGGLGQDRAFGRRLAKAFAYADWMTDKRLASYFLWTAPSRVFGLLAAEHRVTLAEEAMTAPLEGYLASLPDGLPPLQRMLALEQRFFLADHNLLYTDKMSMAAGVEVRVPFLDNDLVRLANALPPGIKMRGGKEKWVLKKAMEAYLPQEIITRPKTGFGVPLRHWLRHELRELVDDTLAAETLRRRGLFDPKAVHELVANDRAGRIDAAYTILGLMCIEIWCRTCLGNAGQGA